MVSVEPPETDKPPPRKKYQCYAVQMMVPSPRLPNVEVLEEKDMTCLSYKGERMKISKQHLKKLVSIFPIFQVLMEYCKEKKKNWILTI